MELMVCSILLCPKVTLMKFIVSDLLQSSSERCSVIAMYGKIVIGAALLSSPQEGYITYLAVRAGWHNSQVATYVAMSP
jgi:hypothetical protein